MENSYLQCIICKKFYKSYHSLCNHRRNIHKVTRSQNEVQVTNFTQSGEAVSINANNTTKLFKCKYCDSVYKHHQSRTKHHKKCAKKNDPVSNLNIKINELQSQIEELKKTPQTTIHNGHINNGTITNNNITIKYGSEDLSQILSQEDMIKICNKKFSSIEQSIEMVHLNKNRPELHNVIINNLNNNFAHIYDGDKYIVKKKNEIIEDLIELHLDNIEMIISETNDNNIRGKLDQNTIKKLEELRERLDDEEKFKINNKTYDNYRSYKINQIKLLIYNCIKNLKIIMNK